jgi:hypothetical protein
VSRHPLREWSFPVGSNAISGRLSASARLPGRAVRPKSAASACFATRAAMILLKISRSYSGSFGAVACIWACDRRG